MKVMTAGMHHVHLPPRGVTGPGPALVRKGGLLPDRKAVHIGPDHQDWTVTTGCGTHVLPQYGFLALGAGGRGVRAGITRVDGLVVEWSVERDGARAYCNARSPQGDRAPYGRFRGAAGNRMRPPVTQDRLREPVTAAQGRSTRDQGSGQ